MSKCTDNAKSKTKPIHADLQSEDPQVIQEHYQHLREKMTRVLPEGHPVQLTLLWEHVVRTRKFPLKVDFRLVFCEILERLKDPEWQVRQHALRVLIDILPTLDVNVIDEHMQSVIGELITNLGHSTPAVRKASLDALRIYLLHCNNKEFTIKNVVFTELNRTEKLSDFQLNVKIGVILSIPLLLFPSKRSEHPSRDILQQITLALADRLADVMCQKAAVRSLAKIRDIVGEEEFNSYFKSVGTEIKDHFDILCDTYNLQTKKFNAWKEEFRKSELQDFGSSSNLRIENEKSNTIGDSKELTLIPPSRVVLETEIKFNKETAITMTILEEKIAKMDEAESTENDETSNELKENLLDDARKISRRVHFGGEEVKLRTPESEESEPYVKEMQRSKIPLPLSPATRIPRYRKSLMNVDNNFENPFTRQFSLSVSNNANKKCEPHIHNANLSPKKSILTNTSNTDVKSPTKNRQSTTMYSPKREFTKTDESKVEPVKQIESEETIVVSSEPAGSFTICTESETDAISSDNSNFDGNVTSDKSKTNEKLKISRDGTFLMNSNSYKGFNVITEKENKSSVKNRARSLDRKQSKFTDNEEKKETHLMQSSGSKKRMTRQKSFDKLSDLTMSPNKRNNYTLGELKTLESPFSPDNQSFDNFNDDCNFEVLHNNGSVNENQDASVKKKRIKPY